MVIERDIKIGDIAGTGVEIEAEISPQLLVNIFVQNTPLHDGAVIISNNKIKAAACILPLANDKQIAQKFIEQQKPISYQTINELCNEVNKSVVISRNIKSKISKNDIYKKIIRLKAQGKSYRAIQKYLKEKHNIEMTYETVRKRAGKIIKESNQLIEALDEETVKKALLRLKYTKNANYAQLNKLAKYYGFDIDFSKNYKYNEKDEDLEK